MLVILGLKKSLKRLLQISFHIPSSSLCPLQKIQTNNLLPKTYPSGVTRSRERARMCCARLELQDLRLQLRDLQNESRRRASVVVPPLAGIGTGVGGDSLFWLETKQHRSDGWMDCWMVGRMVAL